MTSTAQPVNPEEDNCLLALTFFGFHRRHDDACQDEIQPDSRKGATWLLTLVGRVWTLTDRSGEVMASVAFEESFRRIRLPSFWLSERYLRIHCIDEKRSACFVPDKKAVATIRALLAKATQQNASEIVKHHRSWGFLSASVGTALLIIGLGCRAFLPPAKKGEWAELVRLLVISISVYGVYLGITFIGIGIFQLVRSWWIARITKKKEIPSAAPR